MTSLRWPITNPASLEQNADDVALRATATAETTALSQTLISRQSSAPNLRQQLPGFLPE
jgi:hypothetical protein